MKRFSDYIERKEKEYKKRFNKSDLSKQFIPYYESEERIKVLLHGLTEPIAGTVGITTGWKPCFLLMRTSRSIGSSITLDDKDKIIAVQRYGKYVPLEEKK